MQRGVIAADRRIYRLKSTMTTRRLSPEDVRYYVLYWDKIAVPRSEHDAVLPDEDVLIETEVITRPKVQLTQPYNPYNDLFSFAEEQILAARELMASASDTEWTAHQFSEKFRVPAKYQNMARTLKIDLADALPVPNGDTPIYDILEFKEARKSELLALHGYLDEFYLEVMRSPEPGLKHRESVRRLQRAINDVNNYADLKWKVTKKFDLTTELNMDMSKVMTGAAVAGAALGYFSSAEIIPLGAIIGGIASTIKVSAKFTASFEAAQKNLKLSYLTDARNAGFF